MTEIEMVEIGTIKRGTEIGKKDPQFNILVACVDCGVKRWVIKANYDKGMFQRCHDCAVGYRAIKRAKSIQADFQAFEIKRAVDIGKRGHGLYAKAKCIDCGEGYWIRMRKMGERVPRYRCHPCGRRWGELQKVLAEFSIDSSEVKRGSELGKGTKGSWFIHTKCTCCGKDKWVQASYYRNNPFGLCVDCSGDKLSKAYSTTDGEFHKVRKNTAGYIEVWIPEDHQFASMRRKSGYIGQHRLVMAEILGRALTKKEHVHHINFVKDDNRPENLTLLTAREHQLQTKLCGLCGVLKENRFLRWLLAKNGVEIPVIRDFGEVQNEQILS